MKCNVGKLDKSIRFVVGIAIIFAGVAYQSWFGIIGAILIVTSMIRFCPAYLLFKLDTSKNEPKGGCGSGGCGCGH